MLFFHYFFPLAPCYATETVGEDNGRFGSNAHKSLVSTAVISVKSGKGDPRGPPLALFSATAGAHWGSDQ